MALSTEEYNEDELQAPKWLNENFFSSAMKKWRMGADVKVKSVKLTPGTSKGDHYASIMFRAAVEYQEHDDTVNKSVSCIIKMMPEAEGHKKDLLQNSHLFETEIGVYANIIPKYEALLRSVGDETTFGPRVFDYSLHPKKFIIFEDIVPLGYSVQRNRHLNTDELKAVYTNLAKWHAIGYKTALEEPHLYDKYHYGILGSKNDAVDESQPNFLNSGIDNFIALLDSVSTLTRYKPYFEAIKLDLFEKSQASFMAFFKNRQEETLYTLCHGDFHARNMMFKRCPETQELRDVMIFDYQVSYMGSIVNDLYYSRFMLMNGEHRVNKFDELMEFYFNIFTETLKKIGFYRPLPTLDTFRKELWNNKHFELYLLTTFLPLALMLQDGNLDPLVFVDNNHRTQVMFMSNEPYIKELHVLLPMYEKLGYFK